MAAKVSITLDAPAAKIWDHLTKPELIKQYFFGTDRALEAIDSNFTLLDWTVLGRQEEWEDSPADWPQSAPYVWWRRHDEYK
jgi:predicted dithiol-disulfide oxidoreductase (DUF899 family)